MCRMLMVMMMALVLIMVPASADEYGAIEYEIENYCTQIGHPADYVSVGESGCTMTGPVVSASVCVKDSDLFKSGNGKAVTDQIMWYCTRYQVVQSAAVHLWCEDGDYDHACGGPRVCSTWTREGGQYE